MHAPAFALPAPPLLRPLLAVAAGTGPIYRLLAVEVAAVAMLAAVGGFTVEAHDLPTVAGVAVVGLVGAAGLRGRGRTRVAAALEGVLLLPVLAMTAIFLTMVLAAAAPPYADPWLAVADRWAFPVGWPAMVRSVGAHPGLVAAMEFSYRSLGWQPFLLVVVLGATGRERDLHRFLHAWALGLVASVAVFALAPAMSPFPFYGLTPADVPAMTVHAGWDAHALLEQLRDGSARVLSIQAADGLITFPSFHAAGAVLLGWGFARVPVIGAPLVALNIAMLPAIPMIGSHYFVDVVAGIGVAALAIRATRVK